MLICPHAEVAGLEEIHISFDNPFRTPTNVNFPILLCFQWASIRTTTETIHGSDCCKATISSPFPESESKVLAPTFRFRIAGQYSDSSS
ncbi:hypothetical protein Tco_0047167 [Tanacetum coccineum]